MAGKVQDGSKAVCNGCGMRFPVEMFATCPHCGKSYCPTCAKHHDCQNSKEQDNSPEQNPFYGNKNDEKFPTACVRCGKTFKKGEVKYHFGKNLCRNCIKERQKIVNTQLHIINFGILAIIIILLIMIGSFAAPLLPSSARVVDGDVPIEDIMAEIAEENISLEEVPEPKLTLNINGVLRLKFPRSVGEPPVVSETAGSKDAQEAAIRYNNMRATYVQAQNGYRQALYTLQINTNAESHVYSGGYGLFEKVNKDLEQRRVRVNSIGANLNNAIENYVALDGAIQIVYRHTDIQPLELYN